MVNLVAGMTPPKKDFWGAFYRRFNGLTSVALSSARTGPQGWPLWIGMGGRNGSESVAAFDRNRWPDCVGIRTLFSCSGFFMPRPPAWCRRIRHGYLENHLRECTLQKVPFLSSMTITCALRIHSYISPRIQDQPCSKPNRNMSVENCRGSVPSPALHRGPRSLRPLGRAGVIQHHRPLLGVFFEIQPLHFTGSRGSLSCESNPAGFAPIDP